MIRALYTAASGMNAQQQNIDNVAHNLANVNTTGFKKSRVEFEDLVYEQTKVPGAPTSTTGEAPIGLETGLGVRAVATSRDFGRGNLKATNSAARPRDRRRRLLPGAAADRRRRLHARRRSFHLNGEGAIVTSDGYPLRAADHDSAERDVDLHLEGRHRVGGDSRTGRARSRSAPSSSRRFRTRRACEAIGRQHLHRDDGVGRAAGRRARRGSARHDAAGIRRRLERQRRRGNGQHDSRSARLRSELEGDQGRRRNAVAGQHDCSLAAASGCCSLTAPLLLAVRLRSTMPSALAIARSKQPCARAWAAPVSCRSRTSPACACAARVGVARRRARSGSADRRAGQVRARDRRLRAAAHASRRGDRRRSGEWRRRFGRRDAIARGRSARRRRDLPSWPRTI